MIGIYDYTVIATYLATIVSVFGIFESIKGNIIAAVFCLEVSGLLDTVDGRIARTKKNRSSIEKNFGIQIDSLNDVICFGICPAVIAYNIYAQKVSADVPMWYIAVLCFYVLCGLIRLAYFNVLEGERAGGKSNERPGYVGLPITSASAFFPLMCVLVSVLDNSRIIMVLFPLVIAVLFIAPIKVAKPSTKTAAILVFIVLALQVLLLYTWD